MLPVHADIGKLAKQAIFSLHRTNDDEAVQRLDKAAGIAAELAPMVHAEPDLRHGTFSNAMEEVSFCPSGNAVASGCTRVTSADILTGACL